MTMESLSATGQAAFATPSLKTGISYQAENSLPPTHQAQGLPAEFRWRLGTLCEKLLSKEFPTSCGKGLPHDSPPPRTLRTGVPL